MRIKEIMQEKNITQRELAARCDCTETTISRYVNNLRVPSGPVCRKIANALDVTVEELFESKKEKYEISDLLRDLDIKSNCLDLPINECMDYHRAKIAIMKILKDK